MIGMLYGVSNLLLLLSLGTSTRIVGDLKISSQWREIASFSFGSSSDLKILEGHVKVSHPSVLAIYNDEPHSWPYLMHHLQMSCDDSINSTAKSVIPLPLGQPHLLHFILPDSKPAREWHFVIARCHKEYRKLSSNSYRRSGVRRRHHYFRRHHSLGATVPSHVAIGDVSIDLHLLNNGSEFPNDESFLLMWNWMFLFAFIGFGIYIIRMKPSGIYRGAYKVTFILFHLFIAVFLLEFVSLLFSVVDVTRFSVHGIVDISSTNITRLLSVLFDELSHVLLLVVLVQVSSGWLILTPHARDSGVVVYAGLCVSLFYFIAMMTSLFASTSSNFIVEYHGFLWLVESLFECMLLMFGICGFGKVVVFEKVESDQSKMKFKSMLLVGVCLFLLLIQAMVNLWTSLYPLTHGRGDLLFFMVTLYHSIMLVYLIVSFSPENLYILYGAKKSNIIIDKSPNLKGNDSSDDDENVPLMI